MAITAALVKELRDRTGAGMMECKKALVETDGDVETAIDNMRKSGQAKAAKKAARIAAEGIISAKTADDGNYGVLIEINSETDFVSRDENFLGFTNEVCQLALDNKAADLETLLALETANGNNIANARETLVSKIGENIQVRRIELVEGSNVVAYVHGGRIGVLVSLNGGDSALAKDIAMHVAASNPEVISADDVSKASLDKEREIFTAQAKESGKPDNIIEKMIEGRLNKFVNEISLTGQPFIKDPSMSVAKLLADNEASVVSFIRYEVGEGIEKKEEDFAAEVMSQIKG